MKRDFEKFIQDPDSANPDVEIYTINRERLKESFVFSHAALDPYLIGLANFYWGKPLMLAEVVGYRLEPIETPPDIGPYQWHHDTKFKQVKIFILLTDVPDNGQRTQFLPGTHKKIHRGNTYEESRFTNAEVKKYGRPISVTGPAGTVAILDTNGLHRGNRNLSRRRDVWVYSYQHERYMFV